MHCLAKTMDDDDDDDDANHLRKREESANMVEM